MKGGVSYKGAALLLLLLSPSIFFGGFYVSNTLSASNGVKHLGLTASDLGWSANLTLSHSVYFVTGEQIPVELNMRFQVSNPNVTLLIGSVGVEIREPVKVDPTTGIVSAWRVLSSTQSSVRQNFSAAGGLSRVVSLPAKYPPSSGILDSFGIASRVAINGIANLTIYQSGGNSTVSSPVVISLIDGQTFYQTQLSTIISSSSWLVYQLLAALVASVLYIRTRPLPVSTIDKAYRLRLESYKLERSLLQLEELHKAGRVNENAYNGIKESYEKELALVRSTEKST